MEKIQGYAERVFCDASIKLLETSQDELQRYDDILRKIESLPSPHKEETLVRLLLEGRQGSTESAFTRQTM
jgi:hypothetical protein